MKILSTFDFKPSTNCPGGGMVDTEDLKSFSFGSTGSSPVLGTTHLILNSSIKQLRIIRIMSLSNLTIK